MSQLTALEWLALLHPVLAILFVYPVAGATIRLGILAREKRTDYNPALPDTVSTEHWQHGRWLVSSAVVITLWSYLVIAWRNGMGLNPVLWAAGLGTLAALLALWRVNTDPLKASFTLLCWGGLIGLGTQLPIGELPFWSSHFWSGVLLIGLLLFSLAARSGIASTTQLRRLHVSAMVLGAVLFAVVGITGCRDLIQFTAGG